MDHQSPSLVASPRAANVLSPDVPTTGEDADLSAEVHSLLRDFLQVAEKVQLKPTELDKTAAALISAWNRPAKVPSCD